jgi:hypothetical protein
MSKPRRTYPAASYISSNGPVNTQPHGQNNGDAASYSQQQNYPSQAQQPLAQGQYQNSEQTPYQQPSYQQPSYEQPSYQQPSYQQPSYEQPSYQQPQQPSYQQPQSNYQQQQQSYQQQQSNYQQPQQNDPQYQQPQPGYQSGYQQVDSLTQGVAGLGVNRGRANSQANISSQVNVFNLQAGIPPVNEVLDFTGPKIGLNVI